MNTPAVGSVTGTRGRVGWNSVVVGRIAFFAGVGAVVLLAALVLLERPTLVVGGMVVATVFALMIARIQAALLIYVFAEPFSGYLTTFSGSAVKAIGALMFLAWVVRLVRDRRRPHFQHVVFLGAAALVVSILASLAASSNGSEALVLAIRYLSFLGTLAVLADTVLAGLAPTWVIGAFVISCTAAAVAGFVEFLSSGGGRAAGPMEDANDFAFYLVCALPFALLLWQGISSRWRHLFGLFAVILVITTLTTFSRGAMVGIAAMVVVAAFLGTIRLRIVVLSVVMVALAVGSVIMVAPGLVERSLQEKQHVANGNVTSRYASWTIAAEMIADHPVLGVGPGGFRRLFDTYAASDQPDAIHLDVVHQMYLDVGSELGLVGLASFLAILVGGVAGARRALRRPELRPLGSAVCISFAGTLTAACFLSEQYYLPVWMLAALGAAIDPTRKAHG